MLHARVLYCFVLAQHVHEVQHTTKREMIFTTTYRYSQLHNDIHKYKLSGFLQVGVKYFMKWLLNK